MKDVEIHHIHLEQTNSTQLYLKEHIDELFSIGSKNILISTDKQTGGIGRTGNSWNQFHNALAFSCTLSANKVITALEIGLLLISFFKKNYKKILYIKWPNDLFTSAGEKCGGILLNLYSPRKVIVGIGLNLYSHVSDKKIQNKIEKYPIKPSQIFNQSEAKNFPELTNSKSKILLPSKIYKYLLLNRLTHDEIIYQWKKHCIHQNTVVEIDNYKKIFTGTFLGINSDGSAIVLNHKTNKKETIIAGSLRIIGNFN